MKKALTIVLAALLLAGCTPILSDGVEVQGEITPGDESGEPDSNGWIFYFDLYRFMGKAGAQYEATIETLEGDPVHFQISQLDIDLFCELGSNSAVFTTPDSGFYTCDVYLRQDYVSSGGSSYTLTITRLP